MNKATVKTMLAGNTDTLVGLNDWAVNIVREYARSKGYDAAALFAEERARISDGSLNLDGYLKASRIGSRRLLNRKIRVAVYAVYATRVALADRF
jgi:hypothetical protein